MSDEKPLHHRVAEALGWTHIGPGNLMDINDPGVGYPPQYQVIGQKERVPRFDEDWGATGPIMEAMVDGMEFRQHQWCMTDGRGHVGAAFGDTMLEAVCNLVLATAAYEDETDQRGQVFRGDYGLTGR